MVVTCSLPALRKLSLLPSTFDEYILRVFLSPGITELTLTDCYVSDRTILNCKQGLSILRSHCPRLESFSLSVYGNTKQEKLYFIDDILQHLPNTIKHSHLIMKGSVQLLSYDQGLSSEASESTHPCLTSISIKHYESLGEDFFPKLVAQLRLRKIKLKELTDIHHWNEKSIIIQDT